MIQGREIDLKYDGRFVINFLLENKTPDLVSFSLDYNAELGTVILGNIAVGLGLSLCILSLFTVFTF